MFAGWNQIHTKIKLKDEDKEVLEEMKSLRLKIKDGIFYVDK